MATLTLAQVQTIIQNLVAQYTQLAAAPVHQYTIAQRTAMKHKLAELRTEIQEWSRVEADLGGNSSGGVILAEFEEPS